MNAESTQSAIHQNSKTGNSIDLTTDCPKRRAGKPCSYCYVEASRKAGFNAKNITEHCPYNGEILRFTAKKVEFLNTCGGIRMFSFADYMPEHRKEIKQILDDCYTMGLNVKVITKVVDFVRHFHQHAAVRVIHLSIDATGDGVDWKLAKKLRGIYSKVLIRAAIMRAEDVETLSFSDIYTFNHARLESIGYKKFSRADVAEYAKKSPAKVCCTTGSCFTCPVKCGKAS